MTDKNVKRLLLAMNALGIGLAEYSELEVLADVQDWEESISLLKYFKKQNRIRNSDYKALLAVYECVLNR